MKDRTVASKKNDMTVFIKNKYNSHLLKGRLNFGFNSLVCRLFIAGKF